MRRKYIFWSSVIIWMVVIFSLSSDPSEISTEKSKQAVAVVRQVASKLPDGIKLISNVKYVSEHVLRKTTHALEYFFLTMLILIAIMISVRSQKRIYTKALLISLMFAISDELHQLFIPGRACQLRDVAIDSIGIMSAIGLAYVLSKLISIYRGYQGEKI